MPLFSKARKFLSTLNKLPRGMHMIWSAGRAWVLLQAFLLVLQGVIPAALVYLSKLLIDTLILTVNGESNPQSVRNIISLGILFGILTLLSEIIGSVVRLINAAHAERLTDHIFSLVHNKSIEADLAFFEQTEFYDHMHRAKSQAFHRPGELIGLFSGLIRNSVTMVSFGVVLLQYGYWIPAALILIALPTLWVVVKSTSRLYTWQRTRTIDERRVHYFDRLLTTGEFAAELRLFRLGAYFQTQFQELRAKLFKERLRLNLGQRLWEFIANLTGLVMTALVIIWVVSRTLSGAGTVGDLALFYQTFSQGRTLLRSLMQDIGSLYTNSLFLKDLFEFLDLEKAVSDTVNPKSVPSALSKGIKFENVGFSYREDSNEILSGFDFLIPAGKIVAVVGENGAGKSTLVKLVCRFYDPQNGRITIDGTDIREFSLEDLRGLITVIFQNPMKYSTTAGENIALGDIGDKTNISRIERAAKDAGADSVIERLPKSYDQMLSYRFKFGRELSDGEWHRVALARALFRESQIVLLDEPTSNMDPWAEADWLKRFRSQMTDKTAVIITHRFTTARFADVINVMKDGKITESGSHEDLVSLNGEYASSWKEQMSSHMEK